MNLKDTPTMQKRLDEIAVRLREKGLTVEVRVSPQGEEFWHVSDEPEQTMITVLIFPDFNGHPSFWIESFAAYAAEYIVPIVTRIGDARDELFQEHLMASRQRQLPI